MRKFNESQYKKQWDRRFVDLQNSHVDHQCALLGAFGYSTNYIASKTGLSKGQVQYRLTMGDIKRKDIRNGESPFAQVMFNQARQAMDNKLRAHLKKHL